jgi:menaquinone-specific isochorismate synthase
LIHEQDVVTQYIRDKLQPLCVPSNIEHSAKADNRCCKIFKLSRVQHRHLQLFSQLKPLNNPQKSLDAELLQQLHPTPAVCGVPLKAAKKLISDIEGRSRGWYAGAFGIVGDGHSEFCVSIRSVLIKDKTLQAYSGVGLVPQSQADQEWQELDDKLAALLSLFNA